MASVSMEQLIKLGIFLVIIGFIIIIFAALSSNKESNTKTKVAVGGFIGPIPFGFGNDKNLLWFITILSIIMLVIWVVFRLRK